MEACLAIFAAEMFLDLRNNKVSQIQYITLNGLSLQELQSIIPLMALYITSDSPFAWKNGSRKNFMLQALNFLLNSRKLN